MQHKIVIITGEYLHDFVEKSFADLRSDCSFETVIYRDFEHIADIYKRYEDVADGFFLSGSIAVDAIKRSYPEYRKPMMTFEMGGVGFYRTLFEFFMNKPELDPKRVVFDFLYSFGDEGSIDYLINHLSTSDIKRLVEDWMDKCELSDLYQVENRVSDKIKNLWDAGKIDLVFCQYSTIVSSLEKYGIPCVYPYPSIEHLRNLVDTLVSKIEMKNLEEDLPAVIILSNKSLSGEKSKDKSATRNLREALQNIRLNLALDMIIRWDDESIQLYTSKQNLNFLTENQKICQLSASLLEDYGIDTCIGYGIGRTITAASTCARTAHEEAKLRGESYIMDESHTLIGPLGTEQNMAVKQLMTEDIALIAERCKLSTLTIQKLRAIIKLNNSPLITTKELATRLNVTVRNANRILNNLEAGGGAELAYTQSETSKGRPVKVYKLTLASNVLLD